MAILGNTAENQADKTGQNNTQLMKELFNNEVYRKELFSTSLREGFCQYNTEVTVH